MNSELMKSLALIYANSHANAKSTPEEIKADYEYALNAYRINPAPVQDLNPEPELPWELRD